MTAASKVSPDKLRCALYVLREQDRTLREKVILLRGLGALSENWGFVNHKRRPVKRSSATALKGGSLKGWTYSKACNRHRDRGWAALTFGFPVLGNVLSVALVC